MAQGARGGGRDAPARLGKRTATARRGPRWLPWVAGVAATALVVTLAVVVSGFDTRETPREDPSVWVVRSAGQYARVNTETAEIDTVRQVESPSGVVQSGGFGLLLTQGDGRAWEIDPAAPQDVREQTGAQTDLAASPTADSAAALEGEEPGGATASAAAAIRTPGGTQQVIAAGDAVLFHTESGATYLGAIGANRANSANSAAGSARSLDELTLLDPFAAEDAGSGTEQPEFRADAAAIDANGLVALFSQDEHAVRWFDASTGEFRRTVSEVPEEVPAEGIQLAIIGDDWVLFDAANGRLWREGAPAVSLDVAGTPLLQGSSTQGPALVADDLGLWSVDGTVAERVTTAGGVPARPEQVGGEMVAAWIAASSAALWTGSAGESALEFDGSVDTGADPAPVIRGNGTRALVTDMRSGMMWTVPDGRLIPVEQWSQVDPPKQDAGTVVSQDVADPEPPVAVDDAFGVRAGEPAPLPVLLNDYDPNRRDVLTVLTAGLGDDLVGDAGADFGTVEALSDGQGLMFHPSATASGSASFTYRITDGVYESPPATVTVTVVPESVNSAPQWCPVEGCQRTWPAPELAPGGTLLLPIIEAWVDPEGDPIMVAEATAANPADPVRALVTANGRLAVRHTDPNATEGEIAVTVRVVDATGEGTNRELRIRVRPGATAEFAPTAVTVGVGEPITVRPLDRVTGGSGSFVLEDASVESGSARIVANESAGTIEVSAAAPGTSILSVTLRDTVTDLEVSGAIRVTATESRAVLAIPPLRAFVRPLGDTTVDVLQAIPGSDSRSLVVQSAAVVNGELRADVIEHSRIRLSGGTSDGQPGRIGSVEVLIAEGDVASRGRLTVFQVPETAGQGAIAVADAVTVRAGSVVTIPVLDNDVAPPGERLVLHPEVGAPGAPGELAFASGSQLRYLAPSAPGTYTLSYTTYGASSPEMSDVGQVRVTVLPVGSNRDPRPHDVTVRVAPGESVSVAIPVTRADPDGDRVRLVSVGASDDPQLSTSVLPRSGTVQVTASTAATRGTRYVSYTVRDDFGGEADGRLRIVVTDPDPAGDAPVVYSDYVRIVRGTAEPVVVRPLDNDLDPSGGGLEITQVVPHVPGDAQSPQAAQLAQMIDTASLRQGVIRITAPNELGTFSYRYTVQSSKTQSTADGLIVVQVSERIGRQAPTVQDTVLSVRDRAELQSAGVDVVTGRVRWATGDVDQLTLSLWGAAADRYRISGNSIIGSYRAEGDLVPFRLAGTDAGGEAVETFGFLVIPPLDELRLTLRPGAGALSVDEGQSVDADLAQLLDLGPGDRVVLAEGPYSVQRGQASCVPTGQTGVRYTAGRDAPWSDTCTVRVRLAEQTTFTSIPIPVNIRPDAPAVVLAPLTRTIAPGATETIDLADMVSWQGGRTGDLSRLTWQVGGGSASISAPPFAVTAAGSQVQVTADAGGVPGSQQVISVGVAGSGESRSTLTLRVGTAAQDLPRGGTVALNCTVGSDCTAPLVGIGGEYDPFAGRSGGGLQLVSVDGAGCQVGTLQAAGNNVSVAWPDSRGPGGRCTASFTVRDAQNRIGTGAIELDAQGLPRAPLSIEPTGANATSVTLTVALNSQNAHPAVTGVEILNEAGRVVATCAPSGNLAVCTVENVPVGRENGARYLARAVNAVGPSDPTPNASAPTWAYVAPPAPQVVAEVVKDPSNTDQAQGTVRLAVTGSDRARRFLLSIDGGERIEIGRNSEHVLAPGPHTFAVIPEDSDLPPGYTGAGEGEAGTARATVGAAPILTGVTLVATGDTSAEIAYTLGENFAEPSTLVLTFGISTGGQPSCSPSTTSPVFSGLTQFREYQGVVCARSEFGTTRVTTAPVWVGGNPPPLTLGAYTVAQNPSPYHGGVIYGLQGSGPSVSGQVGGSTVRFTPGGSAVALDPAVIAPVTAVQCVGPAGEYCSTDSNAAAWANAPTSVTVMPSGACYAEEAPPADLASLLTISGPAQSWVTGIAAGTPGGGQIPLTITWGGESGGQPIVLNQATVSVCFTAAPPAP